MSFAMDMIRDAVGDALTPIMGDTYTVTTDPQGTATAYTCKGVPGDDLERYRERGLTVRDKDRVVILFRNQVPTLAEIQPGDYISGPSDADNRSNEDLVVNSVITDPANAVFIVAAGV